MIAIEIRKKIVEAHEKGIKAEEISRVLGVGKSTVYSILARNRKTGNVNASYPGRQPVITKEQIKQIEELVTEQSDVTLEEIIQKLDLPIKKSQVSNIVRKLGFNYKKKTLHASEREREDVKLKRELWQNNQKKMDVNKLVFLDESGVNIDMTRLYGRAKKKDRVHDCVILNTPKNTTLLSSIRLDGTLAHCSFEGALNGERFLNYVKNTLVPTLHEDDIVVMDNLRAHKVDGVVEAIKEKGASVLFLPPYSPDFNPIEMMWSKIKSLLRKWKARSKELLDDAIKKAFSLISINDISGWFSEDGYSASKLELL